MSRYLLAWLGPEIDVEPVILMRREIEDQVKEPKDQVEVDLWLESPGGNAHSAFKLALLLRHTAGRIRVVIPDYAKSAATLLALAGHELYLAPAAELGPLDAQITEEDPVVRTISALSIARAADEVGRDAVALAGSGGAELLRRTGLGRRVTLDAMLRFSASFLEPLVRQLDPKQVHHARELIRATQRYAAFLLTETLPNDADEIAKRLVEDFPTHEFVIGCPQVDELGLPRRSWDDYDFRERARMVHRAAESGNPLLRFCLLDEFLQTLDEVEGDEDASDHEEAHAKETPQSLHSEPHRGNAGEGD